MAGVLADEGTQVEALSLLWIKIRAPVFPIQ